MQFELPDGLIAVFNHIGGILLDHLAGHLSVARSDLLMDEPERLNFTLQADDLLLVLALLPVQLLLQVRLAVPLLDRRQTWNVIRGRCLSTSRTWTRGRRLRLLLYRIHIHLCLYQNVQVSFVVDEAVLKRQTVLLGPISECGVTDVLGEVEFGDSKHGAHILFPELQIRLLMDILPLERVVLELSFHLEFLVEESYGLSGSHLLDLGIDGVLAPFPQDNQAHGLVDIDRG